METKFVQPNNNNSRVENAYYIHILAGDKEISSNKTALLSYQSAKPLSKIKHLLRIINP
jgi:hypothetical protein